MAERKGSSGKSKPTKSGKTSRTKKVASRSIKKSDNNKQTANQQPVDAEIRRIEALEAIVDDLQGTVMELSKSLKEIAKIGISDDELGRILNSSIEGEVTEQKSGRIIGWAYNRVDQVSPLVVSAFYGGKRVATTLANKTLEEHKGVQGGHGRSFSIILPKQFYDGKERSIQFKAGDVDKTINNKLGTISFDDGFPIEGQVKSNKDGTIKGWAVDHSKPHEPVIIAATYGDEQVARVVADLKEPSLSKKLGKTNCYHGFSLSLPKKLGDGKKRNIRLVASPWNYDIMGGPEECEFSS